MLVEADPGYLSLTKIFKLGTVKIIYTEEYFEIYVN